MLTKVDEVGSLGEALSQLVKAQLPLAYVADGQNIPGDLALAEARALVGKAIEMAKNVDGDESLLAQAFANLRATERRSLRA